MLRIGHTTFQLLALFTLIGCGPNRWVRKGDLYLSEQRPDAAARAFQKALEKAPSHAGALRGMAAAHLDRDQAIRAVVPAQRANKAGEPEARRLLARALIETGRASEAIKVLEKGIAEVPKNAGWRRLLIEATLASGDIDGAADLAASLTEFQQPRVLAMRSWALSRAGRHDEATDMAMQLITAEPDNAMAQCEAAAIFQIAGQANAYQQAAKTALAALPTNAHDILERARIRQEGADPEGAIRRLSWAHALYPKDPQVVRILGLQYADQNEWSRAAQALSTALTLPAFAARGHVNSVMVARTGDDAVENKRRKALVQIATRLGEAYAHLGNKGESAKAWQLAIDANPAASDNDLIQVAKAWELAGNNGQMMELAQAVVDRNPTYAPAHVVLARGLVVTGRLGWAIGHARKAFELSPNTPGTAILLGDLYEKRGERRSAAEVYQTALQHNPGDTRLLLGLQRMGRRR
jgi:tetratricopeptide (TPR) repeat protein